MNKQYQLRIDILNMLLQFMLIFTIMSMITLLFSGDPASIWRLLILFQASVISFMIGKCTKHFWSYIFFHLLLLAFYIFLSDDILIRVIYTLFILTFSITQFVLDRKKKIMNTPLALCIFFLVMYSICRYSYPEDIALSRFFFYLALAYGLLYILNKYFINLYLYMQKHKDKSNIPIKQIKTSNRIYVLVFIYLSFFCMMAFTKFPTDKLFKAIGALIVKFLRFIFSGLSKWLNKEYKPPEPMADTKPYMLASGNQMIDPERANSEIWELIYRIASAVMISAVVMIMVSLLCYGLYRLYKYYYNKKVFEDGGEQVEVISPFSKKGLNIFKEIMEFRKKRINLFGKSNNDKIRERYRKAVQKRTKPEQVLKYNTPEELSGYAVAPDAKQLEEAKKAKEDSLTYFYEKARYSNEECSREEAQEVKKLVK